MAGRSGINIEKVLLCLLIFSGLAVSSYSQEKLISGKINVYRRVTSISAARDYVILNTVDSIAPGDTVLLIQMKGASVFPIQTQYVSFGTYKESLGSPGMSEFLIVQSVNTLTRSVYFTNPVRSNFNVAGLVQLIRVPSYNSATVNNTLTCQPWDSTAKVGGVLALIVSRNLTLNANIDVSGKGFAGGAAVTGQGICTTTSGSDEYRYPVTYTNSGFKGESQANFVFFDGPVYLPNYPEYAKGDGKNFTGGGGGNGRFSGGGGGSSYGRGGKGGRENNNCPPPPADGGEGGMTAYTNDLKGRVFLGGGGGSSTFLNSFIGTPGGRGGGIVIIVCDTLKGNGRYISANGSGIATEASLNAGAGGGGGGGSVVIYTKSFSAAALNISVTGGRGGNGQYGEGGGGGGGLIVANGADFPLSVSRITSGGDRGTRLNGTQSYAVAGDPGKDTVGVKSVFTGFLYNAIHSSVTGNLTDSVCSNMLPPPILGTIPVGGTQPYTYLWEKSYDLSTWTRLYNGPDSVNYTPSVVETRTVHFRRTVTDFSQPTSLTDISETVTIIVQPAISNNIVGPSDTLCFRGDPPLIGQLPPGLAVPSPFNSSFSWQESSDSINWGAELAATASYDPPAGLETTTWYRRTVASGRCIDSSAIAKFTVIPVISNNTILNAPQDICYGKTFDNLNGTNVPALTGGDGIYRFRWESNINGAGWTAAAGTGNTASYNPVELAQRIPWNEYFYRRIVYSGSHNVCRDTTAAVHFRDYPAISGNTISPDQTIGYDSIPLPLNGLQPVNGDGTFTYRWQAMTRTSPWNIVTGQANGLNYSPSNLTDTTWYRRVVDSYVCSDTSNTLAVNVHHAIAGNLVTIGSGLVQDTVCSGLAPTLLQGTVPSGGSREAGTSDPADYSYKWYRSTDNGSSWEPIPGATGKDYQSLPLTRTTLFRREVGSPAALPLALNESNTIKITVLPGITNIIAGSDSVCFNTQPALLRNVTVSGGDNVYRYTWQDSSNSTGWRNTGTSPDYQPLLLTSSTKYRRIVLSGSNDCCVDTSNILKIGIRQLPEGSITTLADTTVCEGAKVKIGIHLTGKNNWEVTYNENLKTSTKFSVSAVDTTLLVSPAPAGVYSEFYYTLASVKDRYGCMASSLTGKRKVNMYKMPVPNAGPDATVCGPVATLVATPGIGTGQWYFPSAVISSTPNKPTVTVTIDSTFTGKDISHKFYWEEVNWQCVRRDSVTVTFDKRIASINAGRDTSLYSFDYTYHMTADPVKSWETGKWTIINGSGTFSDFTSNNAVVKDLSGGLNTYLWTVTNGTCKLEDIVKVEVHDEFIPQGFSPNNDSFNNRFIITGLDLNNQVAELAIVNGAGSEVFSTSNRDNQVWEDWDGKNSKGYDMPEGTYYYLLKVTSKVTGQVYKRSGFVVLKRY